MIRKLFGFPTLLTLILTLTVTATASAYYTTCPYLSVSADVTLDGTYCDPMAVPALLRIGRQLQCGSSGTTACTQMTLYILTWRKWGLHWLLTEGHCQEIWAINCGTSYTPKDICFDPPINYETEDLQQVMVGWVTGNCDPGGTVIGLVDCIQWQQRVCRWCKPCAAQ